MNTLWKYLIICSFLAVCCHARANRLSFPSEGTHPLPGTIHSTSLSGHLDTDGSPTLDLSFLASVDKEMMPSSDDRTVNIFKDLRTFDDAVDDRLFDRDLFDASPDKQGLMDWNGVFFELSNDCRGHSGGHSTEPPPPFDHGDPWTYYPPDHRKHHGHDHGGGCDGGHHSETPEPSSLILLGSGLLLILFGLYRRASRRQVVKAAQ